MVWLLSVVIGDEGSLDVVAGLVVVPDGRGEGEQAVKDAGEDAVFGTSAVSFQVKLGLEGLVDGLDDLAQRPEQFLSRPGRLALADRPEQGEVWEPLAVGAPRTWLLRVGWQMYGPISAYEVPSERRAG